MGTLGGFPYPPATLRCRRSRQAPHAAAGQRGEYAEHTQTREDPENRVHATQEFPMRAHPNLLAAEVERQHHHHDTHAHVLPQEAHGAEQARAHAQVALVERAHDRVGVGRREAGEAEAKQNQLGQNHRARGLAAEERQQEDAHRGQAHAERGQQAGLDAIGKPARDRREKRHHEGLRHQDKTRALRRASLHGLQEQAEHEGHGKGRAVVNERGQAGEGEHRIGAEERQVEHGTGAAQLPDHEAG